MFFDNRISSESLEQGKPAHQLCHCALRCSGRGFSGLTGSQWTLGFAIVHRATNAVIGGCGFKGPPGAVGVVEIAYGVAPDHRRNGYATEAAAALAAFAFGNDEVRVVRAHTFAVANDSTRVLAKCGFQAVGEVIDPEDGVVWRWELTRTTP